MLALGGCVNPPGHVRGDWQGEWDGAQDGGHRSVELVLNYGSSPHGGFYRMHVQKVAQDQGDMAGAGLTGLYWSGSWTELTQTIGGRKWQVIHLADVPVREVSAYYVGRQGELIPMRAGDVKPDLSENFRSQRLAPVAPTTFGYGRV